MTKGIKMYLIGEPGSGKSVLAEELNAVLQRYGVNAVISFQRNDDVVITRNECGYMEWAK